MKKWMIAVAAVVVALLVAVVILLIVVIGQNNAAKEQKNLERITAICESTLADPYGKDLEAMIACQDDLLSR